MTIFRSIFLTSRVRNFGKKRSNNLKNNNWAHIHSLWTIFYIFWTECEFYLWIRGITVSYVQSAITKQSLDVFKTMASISTMSDKLDDFSLICHCVIPRSECQNFFGHFFMFFEHFGGFIIFWTKSEATFLDI